MYAVIETGGKQYRVAPGDVIRVDSLPGEKGSARELGRVLAVSPEEGKILTGEAVAQAKVEATILSHARGRKILVFHFKRKKQYKKTHGHRQNYTELRVEQISLSPGEALKPSPKPAQKALPKASPKASKKAAPKSSQKASPKASGKTPPSGNKAAEQPKQAEARLKNAEPRRTGLEN